MPASKKKPRAKKAQAKLDVFEAFAAVDDFVTDVRDGLAELVAVGGRPSAALTANVATIRRWAAEVDETSVNDGWHRMRRMAMVFRLTQEMRNAKRRPSAAEIGGEKRLPQEYRAAPIAARLAAVVVAGSRVWRDRLLGILQTVEGPDGPKDGRTLEIMLVSKKWKQREAKGLGVDLNAQLTPAEPDLG